MYQTPPQLPLPCVVVVVVVICRLRLRELPELPAGVLGNRQHSRELADALLGREEAALSHCRTARGGLLGQVVVGFMSMLPVARAL